MYHRLAMNHIMDISDSSTGSHLDLFDAEHQKQIVESLSSKCLQQSTCNTAEFDRIIEKVRWIFDP